MTDPTPFVAFDDDPDLPGWKRWQFRDATRFNAFLEPIHVRAADGKALVRMTPRRQHSNMRDAVHGGALLGFIDVALFAGCRGLGLLEAGGAVTVDLTAQFIGEACVDQPIEAEVELLRETRRLIFLRGLVGQGTDRVASFTATIRKMPPKSLSPSGEFRVGRAPGTISTARGAVDPELVAEPKARSGEGQDGLQAASPSPFRADGAPSLSQREREEPAQPAKGEGD